MKVWRVNTARGPIQLLAYATAPRSIAKNALTAPTPSRTDRLLSWLTTPQTHLRGDRFNAVRYITLCLRGKDVVCHLVGAQTQRADMRVVRLALHHVGPFVVVMAHVAFQVFT